MRIDAQVTHHIIAMKKVAEQHNLAKCSKCNNFQVISDLVHDFINFNALKIILKIHKKLDQGRIYGQMQDVSTDKGQVTQFRR